MKTRALLITISIIAGLFTSSCEKENQVAKPAINGLELGIGNSKTGYVGSDLHIEAEIEAEGKIDYIKIEMHPEGGHTGKSVTSYMHEGEWEVDTTYSGTGITGLKSTGFHKHLDIPVYAEPGDYHFHMIVADQEGNQTTVEEEITIEELVDEEAPVLTITSSPASGKTFSNGETISISGTVSDNTSLSGLLAALVYETDNIADADVTGGNTSVIVMLHTHTFDSEKSHSFTASIQVGAANDNNMTPALIQGINVWKSGNYYILVRSKDAKGNWVFSSRYPIVINL